MDKVIILLPNNMINNNVYLSKLISMGIYNFANNKDTLMYLYNHPNGYKDVAHIHQLGQAEEPVEEQKKNRFFKGNNNNQGFQLNNTTTKVIGFKSMTQGAGATSLIYMLKKYLSDQGYVVALEVNKNDFGFYNEKDMYSVNQNNLSAAINKFSNASCILVDINNGNIESCDEIVYLIEPSIIKLNKLMLVNRNVFGKLFDQKIVLNKSLLSPRDVTDFEYESQVKILYNMPPLNDREYNREQMQMLCDKLGLSS